MTEELYVICCNILYMPVLHLNTCRVQAITTLHSTKDKIVLHTTFDLMIKMSDFRQKCITP